MWYKLKRIMMRPNGVEKQVRPTSGWKPWANTIAYYPLEINTNDYSWNSRNATQVWSSVTFTTSTDGYKCANFTWDTNSYIRYGSQWSSLQFGTTDITVCFWAGDIVSNTLWANYAMINCILQGKKATDNNIIIWIWANNSTVGIWYMVMQILTTNKWLYNSNLYNTNWMHLYTIVFKTDWTYKAYRDAVEQVSSTYPTNSLSWDGWIIWWNEWDAGTTRYYKWKLRQVVLEKEARTLDKIRQYYMTTQ
jgi:hypothetical protein